MLRRACRVALVLAVVAVSACGTQGPTPTSTPTSPTQASGSTTSTETTSTSDEPEAITQLVDFTSPTGNVGCMLDPTYVRCDVRERDWSPPPRPADCEFDYGQGIAMPAGEPAAFVCAGDTATGGGKPLAYGQSITKGDLSCTSAEAGITCRDAATSHGFTISREAYKVF